MSKKLPLLILGLDSLPVGFTRRMAENGTMPFIKQLLDKGSFGALRSVIPSNTGSGWNSAWTGVKPQQHGFFGFYHYDFNDDSIHISTSDRLKLPTFWEILNRHNLKTILINSPMQFPATKLDGVMVSGFMTPCMDSRSVYPPDFVSQITEHIPDYIFDVRWDKNSDNIDVYKKNIDMVTKAFHQRVEVAKLAAQYTKWDVMTVVFKSIDNMLHYTWEDLSEKQVSDYLSGNCEDSDKKQRTELALKAVRVLDDCCRSLAELAGYPDVNIIVMSDHGHGSIKGHLFLNRLLQQWGFLCRQSKTGRFWSKFLNSCQKRLGMQRKQKKPSAHIGRRLKVTWDKTQAVMTGEGVIYLNVKGRQPEGTVAPEQYEALRNKIAQHLKSLTAPDGTALIPSVEFPSQASPKPLTPGAVAVPDILFTEVEGIVVRGTTTKGPWWYQGWPDNLRGCHRRDGIILAVGPAFADGNELRANLYDIAPTVLALYGISVPQSWDGRAIENILSDDNRHISLGDKQPELNMAASVSDIATDTSVRQQHYNNDEEEQIKQRLNDLGYL